MTGSAVSIESNSTLYLVLLAIFTGLTFVGTTVLRIPFPATGGYFNFGDAMVMISGFLLGPVGGFFAGGVGSAMADAIGFPEFVPITFIAKGFEGLFVGLLSSRSQLGTKITQYDILGLFLGSIAMLSGYFFGEILLLSIIWELAMWELITINLLQVVGGSIVAIAVGPIVRQYLRTFVYIPQPEEAAAELLKTA